MTGIVIFNKPPRRHEETHRVHIPLVAHIRRRQVPGLVWWHSPQGAHMGARQGALMKAMGLRPGVADLVFLHRGQFYAMELKIVAGGRAQAEQKQFLLDISGAGGIAAVCHGLDEALATLEGWGLIRGATAFALELPFSRGTLPRDAIHRLSQDAVARLAQGTSPRRIPVGRKKQLPPPKGGV